MATSKGRPAVDRPAPSPELRNKTNMEQKAQTGGVLRMRGRSGEVPPTAEQARPRTCPRCGQPAHEGGQVWIHGHGVLQRQQRGPEAPGKVAVKREVACRRYRCKACTAVLTIMPASALARKHFSAAAMGLALALWGLCGWSAAQLRAVVGGRMASGGEAPGMAHAGALGPAGGGRDAVGVADVAGPGCTQAGGGTCRIGLVRPCTALGSGRGAAPPSVRRGQPCELMGTHAPAPAPNRPPAWG
jgi:hypothetical protein